MGVAAFDEENCTIFAEAISANPEELEAVLIQIKVALSPTMLLLHPSIIDDQALLDICIALPPCEQTDEGQINVYNYQSLKAGCWRVEPA